MKLISCLACIVILLLACQVIRAQPRIGLETFTTGLNNPVDIKNAGDSRLFVVEQPGYIVILDSAGHLAPRSFLDIHDRVKSDATEQGLLGMAFHPAYSENGYFYVNYTGVGDSTHISRFSVSQQDPDSAIAASEINILTIAQPYVNHNGGDLQFGPDGYLYIGMGDGGSAGDPGNRAQDMTELLGKMLRIDINGGTPYAIPAGNPFTGNPDARHEIWAPGLRNPWRFSFDRVTGDLWIGDVGQASFEEIDYQPAASPGGENYGWRCYEGFSTYNSNGCLPASDYTFPVFVYEHDLTPCWAVTGGYVYRGSKYPDMYGHYLFADYCKDSVWTIYNDLGTWKETHQGQFPGNSFSTFGEAANGELYIAGRASGTIYHIKDTGNSGIDNRTDNNAWVISPNPSAGKITISRKSEVKGETTIRITDLAGVVVYQTKITGTASTIDIGILRPGMYILYGGNRLIRGYKIIKL